MNVPVIAPQTQAPIPALDPIEVEPTIGNDLDSFGTIGKFRALINTTKLLSSDNFYVELTGEPGTPAGGQSKSPTLPLGSANPTRSLNLDKKVVAFLLGKKMEVTYTIIRVGEANETSKPPLVLNVLPLPKSELKAALILEAENAGNGPGLDLIGSTADLTLRLKSWPLIAEKQRCWIYLEGKKAGNVDHLFTVLQSEPVDGNWITLGYRDVTVPRSYFAELIDGSELKLIVKVALNQEDDETQAFDFEERIYTVKNVAVENPEITEVKDSLGVPISNPGLASSMPLKLKGTMDSVDKVKIYNGNTLLGESEQTGAATWGFDTSKLPPATYALQAIGQGGSSGTWDITVVNPVTIRSVEELNGGRLIPRDGSTTQRDVMFRGTAHPLLELRFESLSSYAGNTTVLPNGEWSHRVGTLQTGNVRISVGADEPKYGWGSDFWAFEVKKP